MQEIIQQALVYLRGMWHRRWIGLATAWLIAVVGVAVVYKIPEKYEASARVYVDTETLLRPLLAGLAIQPNVDQQVSLISRTLISRPNVEKLIRLADLDLKTDTPRDREELVDKIMQSIKLDGNVGANLYTISYRDADPSQARKVVQSLLNIFVESSLGNKLQDTQSAVKFLDEQIKRYDDSLRAAENRIKDFRIRYLGIANRDDDYFARMSRLSQDIQSAKLELQAAEQSRASYQKDMSDEAPSLIPDQSDNAAGDIEATPEIDARLAALRRDLDTLLRKYTEQHPDVIATRRLIAQLENQRKAEVEAHRKAAAEAPRRPSDASGKDAVAQQMRLALADSQANEAALRAKVQGLEAQYQQLKSQAQLVPKIEAEYTQLTRDYDIQKRTYDGLVSRRESAVMGKDVQDTGGLQFKIIDPPRVSPQPVAPNRMALLALVVALSLGVGLFASLLVSQMIPTFHDAKTVRDVTKRPILGMVSMLPSDALRRRRRREAWLFAGGVSGLAASLSMAFAFVLLLGRSIVSG